MKNLKTYLFLLLMSIGVALPMCSCKSGGRTEHTGKPAVPHGRCPLWHAPILLDGYRDKRHDYLEGKNHPQPFLGEQIARLYLAELQKQHHKKQIRQYVGYYRRYLMIDFLS